MPRRNIFSIITFDPISVKVVDLRPYNQFIFRGRESVSTFRRGVNFLLRFRHRLSKRVKVSSMIIKHIFSKLSGIKLKMSKFNAFFKKIRTHIFCHWTKRIQLTRYITGGVSYLQQAWHVYYLSPGTVLKRASRVLGTERRAHFPVSHI